MAAKLNEAPPTRSGTLILTVDITDGDAELSTREIIFSPLVAELVKCVNISYGDDNLVEADMHFAVTFNPVHEDDSFEGGNTITITVIDDEGKILWLWWLV
jgi:hypothetical protein